MQGPATTINKLILEFGFNTVLVSVFRLIYDFDHLNLKFTNLVPQFSKDFTYRRTKIVSEVKRRDPFKTLNLNGTFIFIALRNFGFRLVDANNLHKMLKRY
jgi:hypothetical protein